MLELLLFLSPIFSSNATEPELEIIEPDQVCQSIFAPGLEKQCMELIIEGVHFDPMATTLCSRYSFDRDKVSCMGNIRGKAYSESTLQACAKGLISQSLQCLAANGVPYEQTLPPNNSCLSLMDLKKDLKRAIIRIQNGDYGTALGINRSLLSRAEKCN